ncbi:MAG: VOC family protein [Acidimicrobiia bacterium]|nr:VOC family protein [Acidimicrobiia bacterium]
MPEVQPIPDSYRTVTPYLYISGASDAIDFYVKVFGATERSRLAGSDGKVGHAEIEIGDSVIMLADEFPDMGASSPTTVGGTPVSLHVYVEDVDATVERAVSAGATLTRPVENRFYGDRSGQLRDPWGHEWSIATHVEDVSWEEMERRAAAEMSGGA